FFFALGVNGLGGVLSNRLRTSSRDRSLDMDEAPKKTRRADVRRTCISEALAELHSIQADLLSVMEYELAYQTATDDTVKQALYYSAIIAYRRAFKRRDSELARFV